MKESKDKKVNENLNEEVLNNTDNKEENIELTKEEIEALNNKIVSLESELKKVTEESLRSKAELVNYRKRKDEEIIKMLKYANEDIILDLLSSIDNFERALKIETKEENKELCNFVNGTKMIYDSLVNTLNKYGVVEVEALDKKFDPTYHQAISTDKVENKEDDIVLEVFGKGYMLKDKLLRPAMVKVNKKGND